MDGPVEQVDYDIAAMRESVVIVHLGFFCKWHAPDMHLRWDALHCRFKLTLRLDLGGCV